MDMGSDDQSSATAAFTVVMMAGLLVFAMLAGWEGCESDAPYGQRFEPPRIARPVATDARHQASSKPQASSKR